MTTYLPRQRPRRTRLTKEQRRKQLVEFGRSLMSERPLEQVTMEAVAERAGVSRALVFHYFDSKSDFQVEIVGHAADELIEQTTPIASHDPRQTLASALDRYLDYVEANRTTFVALVRGAASADPRMIEIFDRVRQVTVDRIMENIGTTEDKVHPLVLLSIRSWVSFAEDVAVRWADRQDLTAELMREFLARSLGGVIEAASSAHREFDDHGVVPITGQDEG